MSKLELLELLSGTGIIVQDLRLFLDINPNNAQALADFRRISADYRNLVAKYENSYGPLLGMHDVNSSWATTPWPWSHDFMGGTA